MQRDLTTCNRWQIVALWTAAFAVLFLLNHAYFGAQLNEAGDVAANSLSVREAKVFHQLYGQYSRWGFRHPGPGWFYLFAAGESVWFDLLHAVPTPINGQLIALLAAEAAFFAIAVGTTARWLRHAGLFFACAIPLGVAHFACVGSSLFLSMWMPHVMALPFAALLIAAASVAAGRGQDLPLLALAGGALLHSHVAQPLFVFPICVVAYGALWRSCRATRRAPWFAFPRAHWLAGAMGAVAALPVLLDLTRGSESNLAAILAHMRAHRSEHHPWGAALLYFLRFGTYRPSLGEGVFTGRSDAAAIWHLLAHSRTLFAWALASCAPALLLLGRRPEKAAAAPDEIGAEPARRFLGWLLLLCVLAAVLTVYWAHIQDGDMAYFNAWFNYGFYFAILLLFSATFSEWACGIPRLVRSQRFLFPIGLAIAIALVTWRAEHFRNHVMDDAPGRALTQSVDEALRIDGGDRDRPRFLSFPQNAWASATAAALAAERRGYRVRVTENWVVMFGERRAFVDPIGAALGTVAPVIWRIVPGADDPQAAAQRPLYNGYGIQVKPWVIDPATQPHLSFAAKPDAKEISFRHYAVYGWAEPDAGAQYVWSEGAVGRMSFVAMPVPTEGNGVEVTASMFPVLAPRFRSHQRLILEFNSKPLGSWEFDHEQPLRFVIPAALWNERSRTTESQLTWRFPDAISPVEMGMNGDGRKLAFGFREVAFRPLAAGE